MSDRGSSKRRPRTRRFQIASVEARVLRASPRSIWTFVEIATTDGVIGFGEATVARAQDRVAPLVEQLGSEITGINGGFAEIAMPRDLTDQTEINIRCALDQALADIEAQYNGVPVWALFSDATAKTLDVYANINRRTYDRSPQGFAQSVSDAVSTGAKAFKIAPLDGIKPSMTYAEARPLLHTAIERIFRVREAIGAGKLMIDCHWRLNVQTIEPILEAAQQAGLFWVETPFPEDADHYADIRRARVDANSRGIFLAGGEHMFWPGSFVPLLEHDLYDVLMPDMKYVGGYDAFFSLCGEAKRKGVLISPHNPSGPICHAHSVHASAVIENFLILEMQFDETDSFLSIVKGDLPMPEQGAVNVPTRAGLGVQLDQSKFDEALP